MAHPYWPLFDLRIRTPRIEVRLPNDDDLVALARVAATGIHDPDWLPFSIPWTDEPSPVMERKALQWWWGRRAEWSPEKWTFTGAVFVDGQAVGIQDIGAERFAQLRTVNSGSWLGREYQGQGIGREMRAALLHLAFDGLGAIEAYSAAWHDNGPSLGVSRGLGYADNGTKLALRRDRSERQIELRLDRDTWAASRRDDIVIENLEPCLELFGATAPDA